jgi:hypothetical protein
MRPDLTPTERMTRIRERFDAARRAQAHATGQAAQAGPPVREEPASGRSFCQWQQWSQFRQIQ